jgi:hypothetical protein
MIMVPRQLRRSDFPSSVPYYGGRLTPQVIVALGTSSGPHPRPGGTRASVPEDTETQQLAMLSKLRGQGVFTEAEYEELRRRIAGNR